MSGLGFFSCDAKGKINDLLCYKESSLDGMGLFAESFIPRHTLLHTTHVHSNSIKNYSGPCDWINLIPNCMFNHSKTGCNCVIETIHKESGSIKQLVSIREIKKGEELLFDYTTDEDLEQPEKDWK